MEVYKSYYFETKHQRISSATYIRELLYSMFTILQPTKESYIPHPVPKFPLRPNISQRESIGYYIILTWQEIYGKLLQSLEKDSLSTWTLEELHIWWAMIRLLHICLMELAFKNGWGAFFKHKADNAENLLKLFKFCEMSFKKDLSYANAVHISFNEILGDFKPCNLEQAKGLLPVIEGKVLLNSQHDFNNLFGIEESFMLEGTKISHESLEVKNLRTLIGKVQEHIKPLMLLLQR
ncbi:17115_t:CDS:1 [Funneliformis geosporum]|nr:17115_t:CDS:1 [Funneliformis geosporum]